MEVILLTKIQNLGGLGDTVKVKSGYARNYLIPYGKAKASTPENIAEFERHKAEFEESETEVLAEAKKRGEKFVGLELTIPAKVSSEGTMFGSVGITEIMEAIEDASGEQVKRKEILLPGGSFRKIGEYEISLKLSSVVVVDVRLKVVPEDQA